MFDKERFHNALALSLGYERIVNDKRISIELEESDDPWVTLNFQECPRELHFKASDGLLNSEIKNIPAEWGDIHLILEKVHQAYQESCNNRF